MEIDPRYWSEADIASLETATSFRELSGTGINVARRLFLEHGVVYEIVGPISTGGFKDPVLNRRRLLAAIRAAQQRGIAVFDQMPFESAIVRLKAAYDREEYCYAILHDLYHPILTSGYITHMLLMPDWETSTGTSWEHGVAETHGIWRSPYPESWLQEVA